MKSTVVGSFPVSENSPSNFKDKLLNAIGSYDSFKDAIKSSVIAQLDAGVDIISDGQVRGDMVSIFTKLIVPFPFGTIVRLSNGDVGIVQDTPVNFPLRPSLFFLKTLI